MITPQPTQNSAQERLGEYLLLKQIALGGMASVSLASQQTSLGLERRVVIKSVLPHMAGNQDFVTMFVDEARLMMSFSHPHIAQVYEAGQLDGRHFIAMEYVNGVTLSELFKASRQQRVPLPYEVAFSLALALAEALAYVHQRCDEFGNWLSIIHRDLKPSNVLVRYDGVVKLIDFGIAQAASKLHHTKTGVVKGTIGYLAPEQILDEAVDQRADVFTLGLLLYQIFLGRYPFAGKNDVQRLRSLINGEPLDPVSCRPDCPPALASLMLRCLSSSPSGRPMMRELVLELAVCAREMRVAPHFLGVATWIHEHLQHEREGDSQPKLTLPPAIDQLREVAKHRALTMQAPQPERRADPLLSDDKTRDARIDAKLDDLHDLLDHDTLFDSSAQVSWLEGDMTAVSATEVYQPQAHQPQAHQPQAHQPQVLSHWEIESSSALSLSALTMSPLIPNPSEHRSEHRSENRSENRSGGLNLTPPEHLESSANPFLATEEDVKYTNVINRKRFQRALQDGDEPLDEGYGEGRPQGVLGKLQSLKFELVFKVVVLLLLAIIATLAYLLGTSR